MVVFTSLVSVVLATALSTTVNASASGFWQYKEKQFLQTFDEGYSILKHNGGNGPYSNRQSYGISRDPPESCAVDQVIMLSRHGERYPDPSVGANFELSLSKVFSINTTHKGDLSFLSKWTYWLPSPSYYAEETFSGPYAGLLTAYIHGTEYRARYGHLWDGETKVPMFSSGYERIIETARKFGEGFFGYNYSEIVELNIISEAASQGADSLTPVCVHDNDTAVCGNLTNIMPEFYVAAARLNAQNPGMNLNVTDIYNLMQMAAFELNARPFSPWIQAFTLDEWVSFGYTQDLSYYYCNGSGDKNMKAVGAVYANATAVLLEEGPSPGRSIFWNFCHDTNITPVVAALGILDPFKDLDTKQIDWGNPWSSGNIVPMAGHLVLERLSCNATAVTPNGTYVRIVLNEAVVPFQTCQDGPGYSCSLSNYTSILKQQLPNYIQSCGIPSSSPQFLDFFWNFNATNRLDYQNGTIPFQQGLTTDQ